MSPRGQNRSRHQPSIDRVQDNLFFQYLYSWKLHALTNRSSCKTHNHRRGQECLGSCRNATTWGNSSRNRAWGLILLGLAALRLARTVPTKALPKGFNRLLMSSYLPVWYCVSRPSPKPNQRWQSRTTSRACGGLSEVVMVTADLSAGVGFSLQSAALKGGLSLAADQVSIIWLAPTQARWEDAKAEVGVTGEETLID